MDVLGEGNEEAGDSGAGEVRERSGEESEETHPSDIGTPFWYEPTQSSQNDGEGGEISEAAQSECDDRSVRLR